MTNGFDVRRCRVCATALTQSRVRQLCRTRPVGITPNAIPVPIRTNSRKIECLSDFHSSPFAFSVGWLGKFFKKRPKVRHFFQNRPSLDLPADACHFDLMMRFLRSRQLFCQSLFRGRDRRTMTASAYDTGNDELVADTFGQTAQFEEIFSKNRKSKKLARAGRPPSFESAGVICKSIACRENFG